MTCHGIQHAMRIFSDLADFLLDNCFTQQHNNYVAIFFCVFKFCFFLFVFASMRERTLFLAICTTFGPNEDFSRISTDFRLRLLARVTFDMGLSVSLSVLGGGMVVL